MISRYHCSCITEAKPVFKCDNAAVDGVFKYFEPVVIPGRLTEQLNKSFFVVIKPDILFSIKKEDTQPDQVKCPMRVKSHGSAVVG
ncbi:hypothetical protein ABF79_17215 [Enterobacter hormaechei subsp. steigerwaltii]|nr:hypothetical protein ABF79_17215 [Enterobacter hormaechei subsp. steigerwaltii]